MPSNTNNCYSDTCAKLTSAINCCNVQIQITTKNEAAREKYQALLDKHKRNLGYASMVIDNLKPCIAKTKEYLAGRKRNSLIEINNAIRQAGEIVVDAMSDIHLEIEDNGDAFVASADKVDVQVLEGGGYRQILSAFLQGVVLGSKNDILQTLILDEKFSMLNAEYSADLSTYLSLMGQDKQIISIEQKSEIYSNAKYLEYHLSKGETYATVSKVEHGSEVS